MKLRPAKPEPIWAGADSAPVLDVLQRGELLLGYQARAISRLAAGVSLLVIEKSRRIGLSWGLAAHAVLKASAARSAGGMNVWYMGYNLAMAREFVDYCVMFAKAFGHAAEAADEEVFDDQGKSYNAFSVRFSSGFKITGLPSAARVLRGKQGLVILDEAAFHTDLVQVLKAAIALLMWGGQVAVVSTHDSVSNAFAKLIDEIRGGKRKGEVMTITFDDALADGLYERIALVAKTTGKEALPKPQWIADVRDTYGDMAAEELDCIPSEGGGSWLDAQALSACEHADAGKPELYTGGLLYIGRDVARRRDLAVFHGYELVGDTLWLRDRWLGKNKSFYEQDLVSADLFARCRVASYWIDQTGMGEKVVEDEQRRYGATRVHGQLLTGPARLDLATSLRDRVEGVKIRVPADPALRADFRAIKKKGSAGGAVSLVNDGDEVHADEFWAAALACRAADTPYQAYDYQPVRGRDDHGRSPLAMRRAERDGFDDGGFRGRRDLW